MSTPWPKRVEPYEVTTEVYSGPLELLLDLIQKAELDITKLALAQVTDQFLDYIQHSPAINADHISEFLLIASKLVQIKSEALLPRPPVRFEEEEDLGESLARQLLAYREVKRATSWLTERSTAGLHGYLHIPRSYPVNVQIDLTGITLMDLVNALENLMARELTMPEGGSIPIPRMTLKKKVEEIVAILRGASLASFSSLIASQPDRLNRIIVFLAILELVKQDLISTQQDATFGDILIYPEEKLSLTSAEILPIED